MHGRNYGPTITVTVLAEEMRLYNEGTVIFEMQERSRYITVFHFTGYTGGKGCGVKAPGRADENLLSTTPPPTIPTLGKLTHQYSPSKS